MTFRARTRVGAWVLRHLFRTPGLKPGDSVKFTVRMTRLP